MLECRESLRFSCTVDQALTRFSPKKCFPCSDTSGSVYEVWYTMAHLTGQVRAKDTEPENLVRSFKLFVDYGRGADCDS